MAPGRHTAPAAAEPRSFLEALDEVSEAVESGAGLPSVARAAGRALDASVIVLDASSNLMAVACASPEDERAVMAGEGQATRVELLVADRLAGELRYRSRGEPPPGSLLRLVANLIGLELERARAPERASEEAVGDFLEDLFGRRVTDRENIVARASELGCELGQGALALVVRARPHNAEEGDWRARVVTLAERGARAIERGSLAALVDAGWASRQGAGPNDRASLLAERELAMLVPAPDGAAGRRVAGSVLRELESGLPGFALTVARSRGSGCSAAGNSAACSACPRNRSATRCACSIRDTTARPARWLTITSQPII